LTSPASASESELTIADGLRRQGEADIQYLQMPFSIRWGFEAPTGSPCSRNAAMKKPAGRPQIAPGLINSFIELM
jgi:hypothetical protein